MSKDNITNQLYKVINTLYIKNKIDFSVRLINRDNVIVVTFEFIIDQSRYWKGSPNYSQEYFDSVMSIFEGDSEDIIHDLIKYVIYDKRYFTNISYRLSNRGVYKPLYNALNEMGVGHVLKENPTTPYPEIVLYGNNSMSSQEVIEKLSKEFNVDDILIYFK